MHRHLREQFLNGLADLELHPLVRLLGPDDQTVRLTEAPPFEVGDVGEAQPGLLADVGGDEPEQKLIFVSEQAVLVELGQFPVDVHGFDEVCEFSLGERLLLRRFLLFMRHDGVVEFNLSGRIDCDPAVIGAEIEEGSHAAERGAPGRSLPTQLGAVDPAVDVLEGHA